MKKPNESEITCPNCQASYIIQQGLQDQHPQFCTYCGSNLNPEKDQSTAESAGASSGEVSSSASVTLIQGLQPENEKIEFILGPYQVLRGIGKGGMGEVFLAYDTTCGRRIALKRIRSDLMEHIQMHNRFLKEARITSQLTHPSIIPIYAIHGQDNLVYYTMPYVEGETLKQILRKTRQMETRGLKIDTGSIPSLVRIFLSICQAIAYAHSKGVLHRDIKPENIIVGQYGEVLILDWGLAKLMRTQAEEEEFSQEHEGHPLHQLTNIGKVVGTVAYMAPERGMGNPATVQSDIYSLGVILYQILTLYMPFKRGTLKQFRETMHLENLYDPSEVAPYRDVPRVLSRIVFKCLTTALDQRYPSVQELIHDLESYIEGRAEWFQIAELDIYNKADWEFQENVLIAEHIAITRGTEISDWVNLMISKLSFSENIKIEAQVRIGDKGHGLGFMLSIPESSQRVHLNDGYCLWIGSDLNRSTKLLRSTVEVMHSPDVFLQRNEWHKIRIEKIDNNIYLYINNILQFSYISHLPLVGTHVGLLSRDADFSIKDFFVYVGSQNVMVNCLAVPDAFLAHKDYATALSEYRRIGYSFPGRAEGREALFRAGITLLEQARASENLSDKAKLYDQALGEFEKLHGTPGAPLEYLGKALTYQAMNDNEEEVKCFELAFRRYPKHPLLPVLKEQIVYRMHTSSRYNRLATYRFILLVVRHMPDVAATPNAKKLFTSLKKHWEPLPFIQPDPAIAESDHLSNLNIGTVLAFWLSKPYMLAELIDELATAPKPSSISLCNAIYCLIELGAWKLARKKLDAVRKHLGHENPNDFLMLELALASYEKPFEESIRLLLTHARGKLDFDTERAILFLMRQALHRRNPQTVNTLFNGLESNLCEFTTETAFLIDCLRLWAYLFEKNWNAANLLLNKYPIEQLLQDSTWLHFLYGCWLHVTEGQEIASIHFSGILEITHPRSWALFSHFFKGNIDEKHGWIQRAFSWEKRQLFLQAALFYECTGNIPKSLHHQTLEQQEYLHDIE